MSQENMKETIVDLGSVMLEDGEFADDTLTAASAKTFKEGTILARDSSSHKLVVFAKGGSTNENGIPKCVLTYNVVATAAGDLPIRVLIAGDVKRERLVIDADGDDANVDATVCDQLRAYSIVPVSAKQLAKLDNIPAEDS
jgi:hypothetical protein